MFSRTSDMLLKSTSWRSRSLPDVCPISIDVTNLITEVKSLRQLCEMGTVDERKVNETIVPKLTNDPQ